MARKITKKLVDEALEYLKQDLIDRWEESLNYFTCQENQLHKEKLDEDWFWDNEGLLMLRMQLENFKIQ